MSRSIFHRPLTLTLAAASAAVLLAACDQPPGERSTARERGDTTVAQTQQGARDMGDRARNAADTAGDKTKDAAITAQVKTKLAADDQLKALSIDVDTSGGQVTLSGTAPSAAARDRATQLARDVSGVTNVTNQLTVKSGG